jgi:hypothetical protein
VQCGFNKGSEMRAEDEEQLRRIFLRGFLHEKMMREPCYDILEERDFRFAMRMKHEDKYREIFEEFKTNFGSNTYG